MRRLAADLKSGRWKTAHTQLLDAPSFDGGLRLVVVD
jgi:hypothetical protein